jgi:hypothetical protein
MPLRANPIAPTECSFIVYITMIVTLLILCGCQEISQVGGLSHFVNIHQHLEKKM